ncbi:hypothetical protein ACP70R_018860 [Stipagrostis hirtigluma subsp. patula]
MGERWINVGLHANKGVILDFYRFSVDAVLDPMNPKGMMLLHHTHDKSSGEPFTIKNHPVLAFPYDPEQQ